MDNAVVWLIIALFYAPLHFLLPLLLVLMRSDEGDRRAAMRRTLIDCALSMGLAFVLVIWLVGHDRISWAMALLLVSMGLPYLRLLRARATAEG